jgi:hypothetical protein
LTRAKTIVFFFSNTHAHSSTITSFFSFSWSMLNPSFAQAHWHPDPTTIYQCSTITKSDGFTYLMGVVMSGRDPSFPDRLARQEGKKRKARRRAK